MDDVCRTLTGRRGADGNRTFYKDFVRCAVEQILVSGAALLCVKFMRRTNSTTIGDADHSCLCGTLREPRLTSHSTSAPPDIPTWFVSHALDMRLALQSMTGQENIDIALRFDLNAPCESAHISLTLSARFTQRTGVFVVVLVALALAGSLGIVLGLRSWSCLPCCISQ